jgi:drug/metabolite transporter (DMT)-like permease
MILGRNTSLLIICACLLWAIDLLVRYPVTLKLSFELIVLAETFVGLIFTVPYLIKNFRVLKYLSGPEWAIAVFVGGVGMSLAGYLQTACIQKATPGLFSFFQVFQPIFVLYLSHKVLKEKMENIYVSWGIWIILSALLMFSVDLDLMLSSEIVFTDILIALTTMLIWGMSTILAKIFLRRHSPAILVSLRCLFAFLFSITLFSFEDTPFTLGALLSDDFPSRFFFMGGVAGTASMFIYYQGLKSMEVGKVSFVEVSYAAFGIIFSAIYTFEGLTVLQLLGGASYFAFLLLFLSRQYLLGTSKGTN